MMMNMMTGAVAINGGVGVMEVRQPQMVEEAVQAAGQIAADIAENAHITLHELKEKIDAVVEKKLPSFKALMEMNPMAVARTTVNDASLTVYQNGYAVYEMDGAHTVMAVDRCGDYRYRGRGCHDRFGAERHDTGKADLSSQGTAGKIGENMKKYLFLNAEDRRPVEESGYRYKKSKPVTAVKIKRDEDGFFIPWAMFRPLGEKGLFCELFGMSPVRRAADLRMNRDLLLKEAYEHEVELLMCWIRMNELQMQQAFCKEEQALELYQQSKLQNMPQLTPEHKRKLLLDAVTWKYDCVQQYKKICFQFAEAVIGRECGKGSKNLNRDHFIEKFIQKANELPEANRFLVDRLYETAWRTIFVFKYGCDPENIPAPWYDKKGGTEE